MKKGTTISEPLLLEQTHQAPIEKVWDAIAPKVQVQNYPHHWRIVEVVPGRKISYEWRQDGHPGNSQMTFELFAEGDKTRLVLTHERLETFLPDEDPDLERESVIANK